MLAIAVVGTGLCVAAGMHEAGAANPKYAGFVIDANNGKVLYQDRADEYRYPASLTKMMTLYIAFEAVEHGEISMDTLVRVSKHAANEPPSKLGLRSGQRIKLRYLVRAAAVKSANDAATAMFQHGDFSPLGDGISGATIDAMLLGE